MFGQCFAVGERGELANGGVSPLTRHALVLQPFYECLDLVF